MSFFHRLFKAKVEETKQEIEEWKDPDREENPTVCDEITLEGVDQGLHSKLLSQAFNAGVTFVGTQARLHGIVLDWNWDSVSGTLHITPLSHPFYLSCSEIETKITELVAKAKLESV